MKYNISRLDLLKNIKGKNRKLLALLVITIAIPVTVYLTIKGIEYLTRGAATTVNISFSQSNLALNPNATTPTSINILTNANTSQVGFVRVEFTFDTTKLMLASEIAPTDLFKKVIKQTTAAEANSSGRVILVLGLDPADKANPPSGVLNIATVSFKAKPGATGATTLTFDNAKMQIVDMTAVTDTITSTNTSVNITTATTLPTATATSTATASSSAQMTFSFKLQGIAAQGPNKNVQVIVKNTNSSVIVSQFDSVPVTSSATGVYTGTVTNIPAGTYDIFIKNAVHLQKKFANVNLVSGTNTKDFTTSVLKVGDFDNNNAINITDISLILSKYTALSVPVSPTNDIYDINNDMAITITDISLTLSNYTALTVPGDN